MKKILTLLLVLALSLSTLALLASCGNKPVEEEPEEEDPIVYVVDVKMNEDGSVVVTMSDGSTKTTGNVGTHGMVDENGFAYYLQEDGTYAITCILGTTVKTLDVPASHNGKPVTTIKRSAFSYNDTIETVNIPASVRTIEERAFEDCTNLKTVNIAEGVKTIEDGVFSECPLESITIPSTIESLGYYAISLTSDMAFATEDNGAWYVGNGKNAKLVLLEVDSALTEFTIPAETKIVASGAFDESSLTSLVFPDTVKFIGSDALCGADKLTSVTLPKDLKSIEPCLFSGCSSLASITIPAGVTEIGNYAFDGCEALTAVEVPAGVKKIGDYAFSRCKKLGTATLPAGLEELGENAFYYCEELASIVLPDALTAIKGETFEHCGALSSVTFGKNLTSIGYAAFEGCNVASITLPAGLEYLGEDAFNFCSSLTEVTVPGSVERIGSGAFASCMALKTVTLEDGVKVIGDSAVAYCGALETVNLPASITEIGGCALEDDTAIKTINYAGTKAQWAAVKIGSGVDWGCPSYAIVCSDGEITVTKD